MKFLWLALVIAALTLLVAFLRVIYKRRSQARFIRTVLAKDAGREIDKRVIASLSTLPDRIQNLEPTIRCLLEQTRLPDEIVLTIPGFSRRQQKPYVIPKYLQEFPRVRILRTDRDWGPATKFIPIVQEELAAGRGDTLIMVVDDDRVYPKDALATYLHYHRQLPDAVIAFRGAPMPTSFKWDPKIIRADQIREPRKVAVITGCGSYLLQPRFIDPAFWDYSSAPAAAFYMDDIWISGWLNRRGIGKYVVPASAMMQTVREQVGTMTLYDVPKSRRANNNEAIAFFKETWNVF